MELPGHSAENVRTYLTSLRSEIDLRIVEHRKLVLLKLAILGAVASFLLTDYRTPESAPAPPADLLGLLIWTVPLIALVFDMLIAGNLRVIRNLGDHIRDNLEPYLTRPTDAPPSLWWEETVASRDKGCYTLLDVFVIWLVTVAAFSYALLWQWSETGAVGWGIISLSSGFFLGTLVSFFTLANALGRLVAVTAFVVGMPGQVWASVRGLPAVLGGWRRAAKGWLGRLLP